MSISYHLIVIPRKGSSDSKRLNKLVENFGAKGKTNFYYVLVTDDLSVTQGIKELRHDYDFGLVIDDPKAEELLFRESCLKLKYFWERLESHEKNQLSCIVGKIEEIFEKEWASRQPPEAKKID